MERTHKMDIDQLCVCNNMIMSLGSGLGCCCRSGALSTAVLVHIVKKASVSLLKLVLLLARSLGCLCG